MVRSKVCLLRRNHGFHVQTTRFEVDRNSIGIAMTSKPKLMWIRTALQPDRRVGHTAACATRCKRAVRILNRLFNLIVLTLLCIDFTSTEFLDVFLHTHKSNQNGFRFTLQQTGPIRCQWIGSSCHWRFVMMFVLLGNMIIKI